MSNGTSHYRREYIIFGVETNFTYFKALGLGNERWVLDNSLVVGILWLVVIGWRKVRGQSFCA
jgi:hypothetical protein